MARHGGRLRRVLTVLACAGAVVALGAGPAAAHDAFVSGTPADGSTVGTAPDQVVLTFTEPAVAIGTMVVVTGPDGSALSQGDAQLVGSTVVQPLAPDRPAGRYTVDWRVTSADGHPVTGTFTFTATNPVPAGTPTQPATGPAPAPGTTAAPATSSAPAQSSAPPTLPPGTQVANDMPRAESGKDTFVGIVILVLVVTALVVVRIGRARSLRRKAAKLEAATSGPQGNADDEGTTDVTGPAGGA